MNINLKLARKLARLSQDELARAAAVDGSTVSKLEASETAYLAARYQTVVNLARVLGVEPQELFPVPALQQHSA